MVPKFRCEEEQCQSTVDMIIMVMVVMMMMMMMMIKNNDKTRI